MNSYDERMQLTRRHFLGASAFGLGSLALASIAKGHGASVAQSDASAMARANASTRSPTVSASIRVTASPGTGPLPVA